jgi:hypothetical protein
LEAEFFMWICGIINEVINIDAHVDRGTRRGVDGGRRRSDHPREQAGVMFRSSESHILEGHSKHVKPVVWGSS